MSRILTLLSKTLLFYFLILSVNTTLLYAQNVICGHEILINDPNYAADVIETEEYYQTQSNNTTGQTNPNVGSVLGDSYLLPVVFHVLHLGEAQGQGSNVSIAELESVINLLNNNFSDMNGLSPDTGISFCLASRDPNGQSTDGINRVDASGLCAAGDCYSDVGAPVFIGNNTLENAMKNLSKWPSSDYINFWIVHDIAESTNANGIIAGYALLPILNLSSNDGIVVDHNFLSNEAIVAHEMGHHLSLHHTFDSMEGGISGGCPLPPGDYIDDTDPHQLAIGCPSEMPNACVPGTSMEPVVYNYMSYFNCSDRFTEGQATRMTESCLETIRSSLTNSNGCTEPCLDLTSTLSYAILNDEIELTATICNNSEDVIEDVFSTIDTGSFVEVISEGDFIFSSQIYQNSLYENSSTIGASECIELTMVIDNSQCICNECNVILSSSSDGTCATEDSILDLKCVELESDQLSIDIEIDCWVVDFISSGPECRTNSWVIDGVNYSSLDEWSFTFNQNRTYELVYTGTTPCGEELIEVIQFTIDCPFLEACTEDPEAIYIYGIEHFSNVMAQYNLTSPVTNKEFYVDQLLIVNTPVEFENCTFYFGENSTMRVDTPSSSVKFKDGSVLTACNNTWEGVDVFDQTQIQVIDSEISKAFRAIEALPNQTIDVTVMGCMLSDNYHAMFLHGDHIVSNFSDNIVIGPEFGPSDWNTQGYFSPTGVFLHSNAIYTSIFGSEGSNSFEALHYGFYTVSSTIVVSNTLFKNIGSNQDNIQVTLPSGEVAAFTAIRCRFSPGINFINNCVIDNCSRGMAFEGSAATVNDNRINVFTGGVNAIATSHFEVVNNNVRAKQFGIRATNVVFPRLIDNFITLSNTNFINETAGIQIADLVGGDIINNFVVTVNSRSGLLLQNATRLWVTDNTFRVLQPNESSGVLAEGGAGHLIRCNDISSNATHRASPSHGYTGQLSTGNQLFRNRVDNLNNGIYIRQGANIHDIRCTDFDGGIFGLRTESFLGSHEHRTNEWDAGDYVTDAYSTLPTLVNQSMQFLVAEPQCSDSNFDGYHLYPCSIVAQGDWFRNDPSGNTECVVADCANGTGTDIGLTSPTDDLELICQWNEEKSDTLTCQEEWVEDYQLYTLVQNVDSEDRIEDYPCLSEFLSDMENSAIPLFYTIDSLLTVQDSLKNQELTDFSDQMGNLIDRGSMDSIDSIQYAINSLIAQIEIIKQQNLDQAENLLDEVESDRCDVVADWKVVFDILIDEKKGLTITDSDVRNLQTIASKCPMQVGPIIYSARRMASDRDGLRYDLLEDCGVQTNRRSKTDGGNTLHSTMVISPNPSSDDVILSFKESMSGTVRISALSGEVVYSTEVLMTNQVKLMTSSLQNGVYFVTFTSTEGKVESDKLVIVD